MRHIPCPLPSQVCCFAEFTCFDLDPTVCASGAAIPQGPGTACHEFICSGQCPGPPDGDMNGDGPTNGPDIALFVEAVIAGSSVFADVCHGDFSNHGTLDVADIGGMVAALLGS